jgi:hypothetical protein
MREAVAWLRANGAPAANKTSSGHMGDVVGGVGQQVIEITNESWDQVGKKANQARDDAGRLGFPFWSVWKPRRREIGDEAPRGVGEWWCLTTPAQWWALQRELAHYKAKAALYDEIMTRAAAAQ